ncbi:1,2-phenylacetyl-CoA epoxidase subunit PaaB [Oceanobacillus sp. FSL H7-0719]|uniref:1,2-phenylacetyl-CoA epoxidase subunit PaaB n=1 Tax=Oceanobacillus sp. FSL H7-0719 TaxID=2954507 RepID=UPI00324A4F5B
MDKKKNIEAFYQEFEVFSRKNSTAPMQHQFSLLAPNHEIALMIAKENFLRREATVDLWVVQRENITKISEEEKVALNRMDNKQYRETKGYGYLKKKWRKYEQEILDEKEIMSWSGGIKRGGISDSRGSGKG